ncbi:MAG: hypothetical protein COV48_08955 [Elusimicrobia bacterium CG11_big_fil_rev_8_21_14_0_20_64_6]|nr:MAG: hypothetical protein COV48_08955 [Elusimicrobia bacterium CG11_big_fil_rev_8_21_14_0_20_64_6]
MKLKIIFITLFGWLLFAIPTSMLRERARESFERGDYCASLKTLRWTSFFSSSDKYLLATLYASGFCVTQDIPRARQLYGTIHRSTPEMIGKTFFYAAIGASDSDERNGQSKRPQVLRALFSEANSLGFHPTDKELAELDQRNLKADFLISISQKINK